MKHFYLAMDPLQNCGWFDHELTDKELEVERYKSWLRNTGRDLPSWLRPSQNPVKPLPKAPVANSAVKAAISQNMAMDRESRARRRNDALIILTKRNVRFEEKNYGAHLIVQGRNGKIDFWPGTGKWNMGRHWGLGIDTLLYEL